MSKIDTLHRNLRKLLDDHDEIHVIGVHSYFCPECNLTMARTHDFYWYCMTPTCKLYQIAYTATATVLTRINPVGSKSH